MTVEELLSRTAAQAQPSAIRELKKTLKGLDLISFADADPSETASPINQITELIEKISRDLSTGSLNATLTSGREDLRAEAVKILQGKQIKSDLRNVLLVAGAQRGMDLVGRTLLDPGDVVLVEELTYSGAIACFRNLGARLEPVAMDSSGLDVGSLKERLDNLRAKGQKVKLLYTIPTYHNPTGVSLSLERRRDLARLAEEENFMILEDDPYGDFWYTKNSERPYRPVASYAEVNSLYLGSFSKSMSPGLRSAYLHGPEAIVSRIELVAQGSDLAPASFDQRVILEFIRSGLLATSFNNARETYAKQHDAMLKSLEEFMPEGVIWNKPGGGFFIWLHVPDNITTVELLNAAVSREVSFIPGKMFSVNDEEPHALRLSFSKESPGRIRVGIASLATAIRFWDMKKKIPWALGDCC